MSNKSVFDIIDEMLVRISEDGEIIRNKITHIKNEIKESPICIECEKVDCEIKKLRQALIDIKKICNQSCNECKYGKDGITCKFGDCGDAKLHLIEKLINQIEGKNNES